MRVPCAMGVLCLFFSSGAPCAQDSPPAVTPPAAATGAAPETFPPLTGPTPPPDPVPAPDSLAMTFTGELLRDLPLSDGLWSIFETVDATAILDRMDNGGLYVGEPGLLGVRGSSWTQTTFRLGEMDVTDPDRIGTPLFHADLEALESVSVDAGISAARFRGPGPVVTLGLRRPGTAWRRTVELSHVPSSLQQSPQRDGAPAIAHLESFTSARGLVDGPLIDDRLGLLVSGNFAAATRRERAGATELDGRAASLLASLVYGRSARDEHRFVAALQRASHPYAGRARFGGADVPQVDRFAHAQWTWQRNDRRPWSVSAGVVQGSFDPELPGASSTPVERVDHGPVQLQFAGRSTRRRWAASGWMAPWTRPRHAVRVGAEMAVTGSSTRPAGVPGPTAETVGGLPARVWDYGWAGPVARWRGTELSLFASDEFQYRQLRVEGGLRFDHSRASAAGAPAGIDWTGVTPRIVARLRPVPIEQPRFVFLAGWARYVGRLPLGLAAYGDPAALQGVVHRWRDENADGIFQATERGPLVARVGPGGPHTSIDPGLEPHRTREVFIGFEAGVGPFRLRGLGYHRRERDMVTSLNVGAPLSAYDVTFIPDPSDDIVGLEDDQLLPVYNRRPETFGQDRYLLTNDPEKGTGKGVELSLDGEFAGRLRLVVGATAAKTFSPVAYRGFLAIENDHGMVGERLELPNATTLSRGRLFFERGYTVKIAAAYRAPFDVRLGVVTRYQDGQHFARFVVPRDLNQGPEPIRGIYNGDSRFTYVLTIDARIEKGFPVRGKRVAAIVEAFNLRGTAIEVEQDVIWGPSYRATSAVQPPRALRLSLRADF